MKTKLYSFSRVCLSNATGVYWRGTLEQFTKSVDSAESIDAAKKCLELGLCYHAEAGWRLESDMLPIYYVTTGWVRTTQHAFTSDEKAVEYFDKTRKRDSKHPFAEEKLEKSDKNKWFVWLGSGWVQAKRSRSQSDALTTLCDILSAHRSYKGSSHALTMKYCLMRGRHNLPSRSWAYLDGYLDCARKSIYFNHLKFGYMLDGKVFEMKWDKMPEEHKQLARESKLQGEHYWTDDKGEITSKSWSYDVDDSPKIPDAFV